MVSALGKCGKLKIDPDQPWTFSISNASFWSKAHWKYLLNALAFLLRGFWGFRGRKPLENAEPNTSTDWRDSGPMGLANRPKRIASYSSPFFFNLEEKKVVFESKWEKCSKFEKRVKSEYYLRKKFCSISTWSKIRAQACWPTGLKVRFTCLFPWQHRGNFRPKCTNLTRIGAKVLSGHFSSWYHWRSFYVSIVSIIFYSLVRPRLDLFFNSTNQCWQILVYLVMWKRDICDTLRFIQKFGDTKSELWNLQSMKYWRLTDFVLVMVLLGATLKPEEMGERER